LCSICSAVGADLGVRLEVGGEKLFVVDEQGRLLPDAVFCAVMAELALRSVGGGAIAVPVHQPLIFEKIAERYGGEVVRTKVELRHLMETASSGKVIMAGDGMGNIILPQFQPVPDALFTLSKLLEFLAVQQVRLSDVVSSLPTYYLTHQTVSCPWEAKGTVMRMLNEQYKDVPHDTIDGIRIWLSEGEWVLIIPDPDRPSFHIYAESKSLNQAEQVAERYVRIVEGFRI